MDLKKFCESLPKIELHAHLNGSLSPDTLRALYKLQNPTSENVEEINMSTDQLASLGECFKVFDIAHSLTTTPEAIFLSTYNTIKEFKEDNVIYLELRSTPRAVEGKMTKDEYIQSMIKACEACRKDFPEILVKLLISVNRKYGNVAAQENVELAIHYIEKYPLYIVGLDLSGDPMAGGSFIELLKKARMAGLKIAAHCAEVPNEIETVDILKFKPDRLGHCTCIHPSLNGSEEMYEMLLRSKIPVELCLTSNVKCNTVPSYELNQFKYLYKDKHPICLSTDDKGVFNTTLSKEYEIAGSTFHLTQKELRELCISTVQYTFATAEEKTKLLSILDRFDRGSQ